MSYIFVVIFAAVAQGLLFLIHWGLYKILVRFLLITNPGTLLALKITLGILSLSVLVSSILVDRYDNLAVRVIYDIAYFWLGLLFYLLLAALIVWLGVKIFSLFSVTLNTKLLAEILFLLAIIVSVCGVINASFIRVTKLKIGLPNLPESWQGKTAIWVSDIHLGAVRNINFANEVAAQIQALQPDIIFIGGDLYDGVAADLDKLTQPFAKLSAPQGTYFITGNHEEFTASTKFVDAVRRSGIKELDNEMINLSGLQIIGVNYKDTGSEQNYKTIMQGFNLDPNLPSILLKHSPYRPQIAEALGIDLQLSGHVHHGQIFPVGLISYLVFQGYDFGLKHLGELTVYISSGIGTWGPPMRVLTTPEIIQIEFYKK
jgi:hypothetical protein